VSAYDEALCVPSELAALTALRTQQILVEETGVTRTADPLGGSYYVEHLTDEIERRVTDYLASIEAGGGLVAAVESGRVHRDLLDTAYRREVATTEGRRRVVGVNCHQSGVAHPVDVFRVPNALDRQRAQLARLRAGRDAGRVREALLSLRAVARDRNTIPPLLEAVKAGATLGECCDVFRDLEGGWRQPLI
jgi:methylmalonyl-CoA mutase N-terminal domain/subunit